MMKKLLLKIKTFFSSGVFSTGLTICLFLSVVMSAYYIGFCVGYKISSKDKQAFAAEVTSYHWSSPLYNPRVGSIASYDNSQSTPFYIECNTLDPDFFIIHNRVFTLGFLDEGSYDGNGNYIMYFTVYVYPSTALTIPVWFSGYDLFLNTEGNFVLNSDFYEYREEYIQDPESLLPFFVQYNNVIGYAINNSASGSWDIPIRFCRFSFLAQNGSYQQSGYLCVAFPDLSILGSFIPHFVITRPDNSDESYNLGYNEGYNVGYSAGEIAGSNIGFDEGYNDGYDEGYNDGYDEGLSTQFSDIDPFEAIRRGVDTFLNIEIFPNFKLSTLFLIAVGLVFFVLILKYVTHG